MTHISKRTIHAKTITSLDDTLVHLFKNLKPNEVRSLFSSLLTKTEKTMLMKRLGIISLLDDKVSEANISKITATTRQTVSRIRLQLLEVAEHDKKILKRKLKASKFLKSVQETVKEFAKDVSKIDLSKIDISRSGVYKRARRKLTSM